jgi:hypothetical protein
LYFFFDEHSQGKLMPPVTMSARLLLGWMPQAEAMDFLLNKCVFDEPLTPEKAIELWGTYRAKIDALPARACILPQSQKTNRRETDAIAAFKKNPPRMQDKLSDVIKIDPSELVIHQFWVATERSKEYAEKMHNDKQRIKCCLGLETGVPTMEDVGQTRIITLPHWEYDLQQMKNPDGTGHIHLQEWPRLLSATQMADRMLLWGGYHRTYALLSQAEPDGLEEPPLVSLISSPTIDAFFSNASTRPEVRDTVLGDKPALFKDFFAKDLFIEVSLRKKHRQLRVDLVTKQVAFGFFDAES